MKWLSVFVFFLVLVVVENFEGRFICICCVEFVYILIRINVFLFVFLWNYIKFWFYCNFVDCIKGKEE